MSSSDSQSESLAKPPDFIRIMILSRRQESVLMVRNDDNWELPSFQHQHSLSDSTHTAKCQQDLRRLLDAPQARFAFMVELLGTRLVGLSSDKEDRIVFPKLVLAEMITDNCTSEIALPASCAWKKYSYCRSLLSKKGNSMYRHVLHIVDGFWRSQGSVLSSLQDPRYQFGWHQGASELLKSAVALDGATVESPVIQHHLTTTSTLLKVSTSTGWYYLKAPAVGCAEVSITQKVTSFFPDCCPRVLLTSREMNCFIMQGFKHKIPDLEKLSELVMKLGYLQQKSIQHVSALCQAGCPIREPDSLLNMLKLWADGNGITADCTEAQEYCTNLLPHVSEMLSVLGRSKIPRTLLHGDFYFSNSTLGGENDRELTFFDWQFAYIGHPFLDFHRIHKDCSEEVIDEYLGLWTSFETFDYLRDTFRAAWKLGWLFKVWSLSEWYEACNPQWSSSLRYWTLNIVKNVYKSLLQESS